jgi:hypothetical protein
MTDKTLQDRFGAGTAATVPQDYSVDDSTARVFLADLRKLLNGSAAARRLMDVGDEQGVTVRFMRGMKETVYVPENKTIFITITARSTATPTLALQYAGALREVEQNILGYARPGTGVDDDTWVTQNAVKNLDIIRNLCIIGKELDQQNQGVGVFLDTLVSLGYGDINQALMNGASEDQLLRLYAQQEQIEIKEG